MEPNMAGFALWLWLIGSVLVGAVFDLLNTVRLRNQDRARNGSPSYFRSSDVVQPARL